MCLINERKSRAKPETEVIGYVVMQRCYEFCNSGFTSLWCSHNENEPAYFLNKWYTARYFPERRMYYNSHKHNAPGFHAFKLLKDAKQFSMGNTKPCKVIKAKFKGVITYGNLNNYDNYVRCFRAKYRKLEKVV